MKREVERIDGPVGRWWHALADGRVQCDVCPRFCKLHPHQRGLCFVRGRGEDAAVRLTTYGRSSGFCVDPIEKKPLAHFLPGTPVLSFGTAGCNLACRFCQNWDISKSREMDRLMDEASPDAIVQAAVRTGARSIAYTYNDPVVFLEYAVDTARRAREAGLKSVAVTAGYVAAGAREDLFSHMDAANVDLKAFTPEFYRTLCAGDLEPVRETLRHLVHDTPVWTEVTTLLIPGHNDGDEEIRRLAEWVAEALRDDVPLHFSAFHPDFRMGDVPPTPPATLRRARRIAREVGLKYVYVGNVHDEEGEGTWCPACGALAIGRDRYEITRWGLDGSGRCAACGAALPGVFEARPGAWGRRRRPVRVGPVV